VPVAYCQHVISTYAILVFLEESFTTISNCVFIHYLSHEERPDFRQEGEGCIQERQDIKGLILYVKLTHGKEHYNRKGPHDIYEKPAQENFMI
jgi:hypothetical protein